MLLSIVNQGLQVVNSLKQLILFDCGFNFKSTISVHPSCRRDAY